MILRSINKFRLLSGCGESDKVVYPLQQDVGVTLLVTSKGRDFTVRGQFPTQKTARHMVSMKKIIFVQVLGESMLSLCALCAETICVSTGVRTRRKQENSICTHPGGLIEAISSASMLPASCCSIIRSDFSYIFLRFSSGFLRFSQVFEDIVF
jgi:hypothetical protein